MAKKFFCATLDFVWLQKNFWGVGRTHKHIFDHQKILPQGCFWRKIAIFTNFYQSRQSTQWVSPRYLAGYEGIWVQRKPSHPKKYVHTPGTPILRLQTILFFGPQKGNILTKNFFICALWVHILVWSTPNYFSRKAWSEKIILHTLDTFHWWKLMPTQLFEVGYFSSFLRVLRQYFS